MTYCSARCKAQDAKLKLKTQNFLKKNFKLYTLVLRFSLFAFRSLGFCILHFAFLCYAQEIKEPSASGRFYPAAPAQLSQTIERFFDEVTPQQIKGDILVVIAPHAGYQFSGRTAAYGFKLVEGRHFDTVLILGPSHYVDFRGASVWLKGAFRSPLGDIPVDEDIAYELLLNCPLFFSYPDAFLGEHSIEVELPFLQKALDNFKIVPIVLGFNKLEKCKELAKTITKAIKGKNCLIVASSDMYHGFDYQQAGLMDIYTLSLIKEFKIEELYQSLREGRAQLCGGTGVVIALLAARDLGFNKVEVLNYTNTSEVLGEKQKGQYCVGYSSAVIYKENKEKDEEGEEGMLSERQRKRLLEIARKSIETYLSKGEKLEVEESDSSLVSLHGTFVTLRKHTELRGCIGNLVGQAPLYLTVRDMAIEAAVGDPRFPSLKLEELSEVEIEISVLSPLEKITDLSEIEMGKHGVEIRKGFHRGVFLPQVATETGWSREEFLSNLCAHKAGLPFDAWKDPSTEIYIFSAEVFCE
ncbi:MAG: AmmeMemoRadiSam system protein B [Candidatus Omnitrophica bacterium]|nr:AmmeMemoRadiSam system protein B [Candidatus Omnitrophota bacterium]